ncbi:zeta-sarcoglycan, partial [Sigmodon hispidus]
ATFISVKLLSMKVQPDRILKELSSTEVRGRSHSQEHCTVKKETAEGLKGPLPHSRVQVPAGPEYQGEADCRAAPMSKDSPLVLQSDRNVTVNARNQMGQLTGQLTVGAEAVEAQCKRFEVRASEDGRVLFSADEDEITIGAEKLRVTGTEGAVFGHSVETPHIRAEPSQDLRLESPTRSLIMEAPRGVQVSAAAGDFKAACRKELHLQSTEGEIFLNADTIRLGNLPTGSFSSSPSSSNPRQTVYELCVCPNGKLYLSPAGCRASSDGPQSKLFQDQQGLAPTFSSFTLLDTVNSVTDSPWEKHLQKETWIMYFARKGE